LTKLIALTENPWCFHRPLVYAVDEFGRMNILALDCEQSTNQKQVSNLAKSMTGIA